MLKENNATEDLCLTQYSTPSATPDTSGKLDSLDDEDQADGEGSQRNDIPADYSNTCRPLARAYEPREPRLVKVEKRTDRRIKPRLGMSVLPGILPPEMPAAAIVETPGNSPELVLKALRYWQSQALLDSFHAPV